MKKPASDSQKKMATEKKMVPAVNKQDNKYGSWGPVYKNKEHFVNMHICWDLLGFPASLLQISH